MARLTIGPMVTADTARGDSRHVNGVCLTVVDVPDGQEFTADVMAETLNVPAWVTTAQPGEPGTPRRWATAGGHIVQGHVDATG